MMGLAVASDVVSLAKTEWEENWRNKDDKIYDHLDVLMNEWKSIKENRITRFQRIEIIL
jgi:hypothetical protein